MASSSTIAARLPPPRRCLLLAILALSLQAHIAYSFYHPFSTFTRVKKTALNNEVTPLPFFAAPASFTTPAPVVSTPQSSTVTLRLPLGTLFDGRDYIFVTYTNVRGYEWGVKEVNVLVEDLMDAALGSLGGELREKGSAAPTLEQQTLITDFELSQICLVPTSDWDATSLGLGKRYDVYDGQQRLVTLNLLLAALRDSFQSEAKENAGGKRGVALEATANEISNMLKPARVRKDDVLRITLRKRDNVLLERILSPEDEDDGCEQKEEPIITLGEETPTSYLSKLTQKEKNELLKPLSFANARIVQNFLHISDRLSLLSTRERLRLLDYIVERVHLLVCIPETSRIARNIVMSQGRKGMDNEAIDDFKGLVCFRYTLEENDMYQTFDRWDALAADPVIGNRDTIPLSNAQSDSTMSLPIRPVGRDTIAAACLLRATACLRTKIRCGGGDEVYEWERWLRHMIYVENQKLAGAQGDELQQSWQGKDFLAKEIEPASLALDKFRNCQWEEFNFFSKKMTKQKKSTILSQLNFLRDLIGAAASAKEAEIIVLEWLIRAEKHANNNENKLLNQDFDDFLPLIEKWALWMALARPSPMQRHARVFALLDMMESNRSDGVTDSSSDDDLATLKESMNEYKFGTSAGGKRVAAAILSRMNSFLMITDGKTPSYDEERAVSFILPEKITKGSGWETWSEEKHEECVNCLGNLALTSKSDTNGKRKRTTDSTWEAKVKAFKKEKWPMTNSLADSDMWDIQALHKNQENTASLFEQIWMTEIRK